MTYEALVIGTGFGGAVAACRLAQAGVRTCVLERGRRYGPGDFPRLRFAKHKVPDLGRWRWTGDRGLHDLRDVGDLLVAQAAGFGGGSLIYANVHLRAPPEVFDSPAWPASIDRAAMDPWYDLVAYMLDVRPISAAPFHRSLAKTERMKQVAAALGREADLFEPPLAVRFGPESDAATNRFGRPQQTCNGCGECCIGCDRQAKNTLDLNYLAIAEDSERVDVRCLAEARTIERLESGVYRVHYRDHLEGGVSRSVDAATIFLGAGSLGTTELLLRSRARGQLEDLPAALGTAYHANGDGVAMVYDTTEPLRSHQGPTITTVLRHDRQSEDADWFLVQEGGFPASMRPLFGQFRGGVWMSRNRFREAHAATVAPGRVPPADGAFPTPETEGTLDELTPEAIGDLAGSFWELFASGRDDAHLTDWLVRDARDRDRGNRVPRFDAAILPPVVSQVAGHALDRAREIRARETAKLRHALIEALITARGDAILEWFTRPLGRRAGDFPRLRSVVRALVRWASAVATRLVGGLPGLQEAAFGALRELYQLSRDRGWHLAVQVGWKLMLQEKPDDRSAMLLVMGRDKAPGRLFLDGGELQVRWASSRNASLYSSQTRVMRDIAAALGGELRTNPFWSIGTRPITVHSQGGCPMDGRAGSAVCNEHGQVHGHPNLVVVDAALLPVSVGVNPSATIAALAERTMSHAVARLLGRDVWVAPQFEEARRRGSVDPFDQPAHGSPAPRSQPVGIRFVEILRGFHAAPRPGDALFRAPDVTVFDELATLGAEQRRVVEAEVHVAIEDLDRFLLGPRHQASLSGTVTLEGPGPATERWRIVRGLCRFMGRVASTDRARQITYRMILASESDSRLRWLVGEKRLRDGPGLTSWTDTTTVRFRLHDLAPGAPVLSGGVLKLHVADLTGVQLPSFEVTGTEDTTAQAWALGRFVRFFLGHMADVYLNRRMLRLFDPLASVRPAALEQKGGLPS